MKHSVFSLCTIVRGTSRAGRGSNSIRLPKASILPQRAMDKVVGYPLVFEPMPAA